MQLFHLVAFSNLKIRVFREGVQDVARPAYSLEATRSFGLIHSIVTLVQFVFHRFF